ncbi:RNA-directed DNA polymerase, eukaryota, reverse transcriptase zinc-binding domain protein [Tanacetum coccineum]
MRHGKNQFNAKSYVEMISNVAQNGSTGNKKALFKSLLIKVMDQGDMDDVIYIQEEFDNIVWPNLKSEVDILIEYHLDPSDDDVESKVDGIVADMKPEFEIDAANKVENVAAIDNNVSNVVLGDFNATLDPLEKSSGGSKVTTAMSDFRDCISDIEIEDIAIFGLSYTWNKSLKKVGGLLKKLDRCLSSMKLQKLKTVGIKSLLMLFGITDVLNGVYDAQSKLVLLENFNENYSKCLRLLYKVNAAEGVNAASKEVSIAELVSIAYVLSKEFNLLKWDQQVVSELVEKL